MPPQIRVGASVKVSGLANGTTTVTATILDIDATGVTVQLNSPGTFGCQTWHVDLSQLK